MFIADSPLFFHEILDRRVVTLSGDEATHASKSRRLGPGDRICLTNGYGALCVGTITSLTKHPITLQVSLEQCNTVAVPETELILASALPKGGRMSTLLDLATQLGMQVFQPIDCSRSIVRYQPKMRGRWQRIIFSAAKQCRQVYFPSIKEPLTVQQLLSVTTKDTVLIYGDPSGDSLIRAKQCIIHRPKRLIILIGPEGGLDEEETQLLKANSAVAINLGSLILRTEAAALSLLAIANNCLSGCMTIAHHKTETN